MADIRSLISRVGRGLNFFDFSLYPGTNGINWGLNGINETIGGINGMNRRINEIKPILFRF